MVDVVNACIPHWDLHLFCVLVNITTQLGCAVPQLHIVSEASAELNKSLLNRCDWYITRSDVKHMKISD